MLKSSVQAYSLFRRKIMAKETMEIMAYQGVDKVTDIYGVFGWKLLSQKGIYGLELTMYRETEQPHYEELVAAQKLYEAKEKEARSLKKPVKPDEPGLFDFKGKKEYKQKLADFFHAETVCETTRSNLYKEMKQIVEDCRLKYFTE